MDYLPTRVNLSVVVPFCDPAEGTVLMHDLAYPDAKPKLPVWYRVDDGLEAVGSRTGEYRSILIVCRSYLPSSKEGVDGYRPTKNY